ncbi:hypothetical protein [Saccharicrinis aurantiacus]|uniref:hypothetical protein n=1 Tax=Saccharicrinis aurantiacus TaxID=1849719 RepID=UPI0024926104|nr:hypothetical protein [Saccharicrinis aurantiacus]
MEKSYSLENPWGFSFRGVFLIILGVFALTNKPNTFEPLMLILSMLYLFSSFMTIAGMFVLKKEPVTIFSLLRLFQNVASFVLMAVGFLAYYNSAVTLDAAREYAITLILISFLISLIRIIVDLIYNIKQNPHYALILIIECVLMSLLVMSFYQVYTELGNLVITGDAEHIIHNLTVFGSIGIAFGIIEIVLNRLIVVLKIK